MIYNFYFETGYDASNLTFYNMAGRMYSSNNNSNNVADGYSAVPLIPNSNITVQTPSSAMDTDNLILCEPSQIKQTYIMPCSCKKFLNFR